MQNRSNQIKSMTVFLWIVQYYVKTGIYGGVMRQSSGYVHYSDIIKLLQNCIGAQNKLSNSVLYDTTFSSKT